MEIIIMASVIARLVAIMVAARVMVSSHEKPNFVFF